MTKLLHPATDFVQRLEMTPIRFADMTKLEQWTVYNYMYADGDGAWRGCYSLNDAIELHGDLVLKHGEFFNNEGFKRAFASTVVDDDTDGLEWFNSNCMWCTPFHQPNGVMLFNRTSDVAEFGMFENPETLYSYWARKDTIPFIQF